MHFFVVRERQPLCVKLGTNEKILGKADLPEGVNFTRILFIIAFLFTRFTHILLIIAFLLIRLALRERVTLSLARVQVIDEGAAGGQQIACLVD